MKGPSAPFLDQLSDRARVSSFERASEREREGGKEGKKVFTRERAEERERVEAGELKIQVRKGETNYLRIGSTSPFLPPSRPLPIGLLRAAPFILLFHLTWENDRGLLARGDCLAPPPSPPLFLLSSRVLFPPPSIHLSPPRLLDLPSSPPERLH